MPHILTRLTNVIMSLLNLFLDLGVVPGVMIHTYPSDTGR